LGHALASLLPLLFGAGSRARSLTSFCYETPAVQRRANSRIGVAGWVGALERRQELSWLSRLDVNERARALQSNLARHAA
jgi:hypothetical protein